jgi:hypothetical protein
MTGQPWSHDYNTGIVRDIPRRLKMFRARKSKQTYELRGFLHESALEAPMP